MNRRFSSIFFGFSLLFFSSSESFASSRAREFARVPRDRALQFHLTAEFYRTNNNFKAAGVYDSLPKEGWFQYTALRPKAVFFPWRWLSFHAAGEGMQASAFKNNNLDSDNRSGFYFNSYSAGAALHNEERDPLYISLGFTAGNSFRRFDKNTEELITHCGCFFTELNSLFIYNIQSLVYGFWRSDFRYRSAGLSSLWFHSLGAYFETERFNAGLSADGFFPMFLLDSHSTSPRERELALQRVNADSRKFYAVNPAALSWTAWLGAKAGLHAVYLYGNLETYGKNYSKGFSAGVSLQTAFAGSAVLNWKDYRHLNRPVDEEEEDGESGASSDEFFSEEGEGAGASDSEDEDLEDNSGDEAGGTDESAAEEAGDALET